MIELLLAPYRFFERAQGHPPRPWLGLLVAALANLTVLLAYELATRELPKTAAFSASGPWRAVDLLLGIPLSWGLLGLVLHFLTGLGPRAFELAGWVFAPWAVLGPPLLMVSALIPVEARLAPFPDDPALRAAWLDAYQRAVQTSFSVQLAHWARALRVLWGGWILYAGVRTLAPKRAVLATGAYLILQLAG